jgi:hypothetical protein
MSVLVPLVVGLVVGVWAGWHLGRDHGGRDRSSPARFTRPGLRSRPAPPPLG